jgi:hypothetical protein
MRMSVDSADVVGYQTYQRTLREGKIARVWLNGVEQIGCVMADEERGVLERMKVDRLGKFIVDPINQKFNSETVQGVVTIRFEDAATWSPGRMQH